MQASLDVVELGASTFYFESFAPSAAVTSPSLRWSGGRAASAGSVSTPFLILAGL